MAAGSPLDATRGILPAREGFAPLLERWPNLIDQSRVAIIGRSVAFLDWGAAHSRDFEPESGANRRPDRLPPFAPSYRRELPGL
jgi:hypothetical protein